METNKELQPVAKRKPPAAGMGRRKGSVNKTTRALKEAILKAAEIAGSNRKGKDGLVGYCTYLAVEEPKSFAVLLGKVLPMQVTGEDGGAINSNVSITVRFVGATDAAK